MADPRAEREAADSDPDPDPEPREPDTPAAAASNLGRQLLRARIPAWAVLVGALLAATAVFASWLLRDVPEFGPALTNAETVDVDILMCNDAVDEHDVNPRQAELDLEAELTEHGTGEADVRVRRRDCPTASGQP